MSNRRAAFWFFVYWVIGFCVAGPVAYTPNPTLLVQPMSTFIGPFVLGAIVGFFPWVYHINRASERKAKRELAAMREAQAQTGPS